MYVYRNKVRDENFNELDERWFQLAERIQMQTSVVSNFSFFHVREIRGGECKRVNSP